MPCSNSRSPRLGWALAALAVTLLSLISGSARASTSVPAGNLTGTQVWTVAGSPYLLTGDVTLIAGASLTVEAGAEVKIAVSGDSLASGEDTSRTELRIAGTLVVEEGSDPAHLHGSAGQSSWFGVVVLSGGSATFKGAEIDDAMVGIWQQAGASLSVTGGRISGGAVGIRASGQGATISSVELSDHSSWGLRVNQGATATADQLLVHDNDDDGVSVDASTLTLTGSTIYGNSDDGVSIVSAAVTLSGARIYGNGGDGINITNVGATRAVSMTRNTVYDNDGSGIYAYESSGSLSLIIRDNILASNGSRGIYQRYCSTTVSHNLVWGHGTDYDGVSGGTGALSENPLFIRTGGAPDLGITEASPARRHASDGGDMGALAWAGEPTGPLMGHLYEDTVLGLDGSPYEIEGDLTIEPGVTLSVEPGVTFNVAVTDGMAGNLDVSRVEVRVLGTLEADGTPGEPIQLRSARGSPRGGDWYGISLSSSSSHTFLDEVHLDHTTYGLRAEGADATNLLSNTVITAPAEAGAWLLSGTRVVLSGVTITGSSDNAIEINASSPTITGCLLHDNARDGINVVNSSSTQSVTMTHNTVFRQGGHGVYIYESSGSLSFTLRDNIIANNASRGIYQRYASATVSHNLVWGNGSDYDGVSGGAGALSENPLFVSTAAAPNLGITSNSPARLHASDGGDMGARSYAGAPTPSLTGHLYASATLSAAASPHRITGDLTVEPGVTLTVEAGATLEASTADLMSAGLDLSRVELRVLGTLAADGTPGSPITLRSAAASPGSGDWYGIHLASTAASSVVDEIRINHAVYGIHTLGAGSSNSISNVAVAAPATSGAYLGGGATLSLSGLVVWGAGDDGIAVYDASPSISRSLIYDNAGDGINIYNGSGSHTVSMTYNTIYRNGGSGVYAYEGSGSLNLGIRNNILVNNASRGIYERYASATVDHNLAWGNGTDYDGVSGGAGAVSENPLFVNAQTPDLNLTSRSAARMHASDGGDIGALPWAGEITPVLAGHLYEDTTLTAAGSPHHLTGDLTVEPGVTLNIEAGARLEMARTDQLAANLDLARIELRILGTLAAEGEAGSPIGFESAAGSPQAGDWYGIYLGPTSSSSRLDHAVIEHAAIGIHAQGANNSNVISNARVEAPEDDGIWVTSGANLSLSGVSVSGAGNDGIAIYDASPSVSGALVFDNDGDGINVYNASGTHSVSMNRNTVYRNGGMGIYIYEGSGTLSVTIRDNIIALNASRGIYQRYASATVSHNLVWGNGSDYDGVSGGTGALSENPLFISDAAVPDLGITDHSPARLHASNGADMGALAFAGAPTGALVGHLYEDLVLSRAASPWAVPGDLTVEPGITLTVEPGTTLRFAPRADHMGGNRDVSTTELRVMGTLVADGTGSLPITFESSRASPQTNDWGGIHLMSTAAACALEDARIRHAVAGVTSDAGQGNSLRRVIIEDGSDVGVNVTSGALIIDAVAVHDMGDDGIRVGAADPAITGSLLYDNGGDGLNVYNSSGTHSTSLIGNTIFRNGGSGIYAYESSGTLSITVRDNIIAQNANRGIYQRYANAAVSYNLAWGNSTDYDGASSGAGALSENPLFVSTSEPDLNLTSRSPARLHASDGGDMGALAWAGALTNGLHGHIYEDETWPAGSAITLQGDVTVEPGVTLTIAPGAVIKAAAGADIMGGNRHAARTEVRVGGTLSVQGSALEPVVFTSSRGSPTSDDWNGVELLSTASGSELRYADIGYSLDGLRSSASATNRLAFGAVHHSGATGIRVVAGALVVDGVQVHHNREYGLRVETAAPTIANLVAYENDGGGINIYSASSTRTVLIRHATVADNGGDGIYIYESSGTLSVTVEGCIVSGNSGYGIRQNYASVTTRYNDVWGHSTDLSGVSAGTGSISANPLFVSPETGNYHLQETSLCVDAANPSTVVASDADGLSRPIDGLLNGSAVADMGAYEFNPDTNKWPVADAGADRVVQVDVPFTLDASGSYDEDGEIVSYSWDMGDGTILSGAQPQHTYTSGTDRVVVLTVTDDDGATDIDEIAIEVNIPPTAAAGSDKYADAGETVSFNGSASTDSDGQVVSYAWDFGDGSVGSGAQPQHAYESGGDYTVTLTVTDDDGATGTDTLVVHVLSPEDTQAPVITHTPIADGQPEGEEVTITASVTDDTGVGAAYLYYRANGSGPWAELELARGPGDSFVGQIPAQAVVLTYVQYYLTAVDTAPSPNSGALPTAAPASVFRFTVADTHPPVITHTPVGGDQPEGQPVTIDAQVSDASGVGSVTLYYRPQGQGSYTSRSLTSAGDGRYTGAIPGDAVSRPAVEYYLVARDLSAAANEAAHPAAAPASVHTFGVADATGPEILHTPIADGQPAGEAVLFTAEVSDASGVAEVNLLYRAAGEGSFNALGLADSGGGRYQAQLPGEDVSPPGVEYYLSATDEEGNVSTHPAGAPGTFHPFTVERSFDIEAGQLVITEIMVNPSLSESTAEWIEVYNPTDHPIDLSGVTFSDDGSDAFSVDASAALEVTAGGYVVLGRSDEGAANGGVSVDYVYAGFQMSNSADEVVITAGDVEIDRVAWTSAGGWPLGEGASMTLDPDALDADSNDLPGSWCPATSPLSGGDAGTPGAANDRCSPPPDEDAPIIAHTPIQGGQPEGQAVAISATLTDASGIGAASVFYKILGGGGFTEVALAPAGEAWSALIPAEAVTTAGVAYYLTATDASEGANQASAPPAGAAEPYTFAVTATDTSGPSILHTPPAGPLAQGEDVDLIATVQDGSGIADATLRYETAGGWVDVEMIAAGGDHFSAAIPGDQVRAPRLRYILMATDASPAANASTLPQAGEAAPFEVAVQAPDVSPPAITHTPIPDGQRAGEAVAIVATVTDETGVAEVQIHFRPAGTSLFLTAELADEGGGRYAVDLPGNFIAEPGVEYYLSAADTGAPSRSATLPAGAPGTLLSFAVVTPIPEDLSGPIIDHTPPEEAAQAGASVPIVAAITDASGVDGASLFYRLSGEEAFTELAMGYDEARELYTAEIPSEDVQIPALEYYLAATDLAPAMNSARAPATAPDEVFEIEVLDGTPTPSLTPETPTISLETPTVSLETPTTAPETPTLGGGTPGDTETPTAGGTNPGITATPTLPLDTQTQATPTAPGETETTATPTWLTPTLTPPPGSSTPTAEGPPTTDTPTGAPSPTSGDEPPTGCECDHSGAGGAGLAWLGLLGVAILRRRR